MYTVNTDGTVYKMMVKNTVESEIVGYDNLFKSCDYTEIPTYGGMCHEIITGGSPGNTPAWCKDGYAQFDSSYAVWGGYATPVVKANPSDPDYDKEVEDLTEDIICNIQ